LYWTAILLTHCGFPLASSFLLCRRHHRDLHSFPTRRSSDLTKWPDGAEPSFTRAVRTRATPHQSWRFAWPPRPRQLIPRLMALLDRKSTRLNSSHVKISYAVFCLKKKKKRPDTSGRVDRRMT